MHHVINSLPAVWVGKNEKKGESRSVRSRVRRGAVQGVSSVAREGRVGMTAGRKIVRVERSCRCHAPGWDIEIFPLSRAQQRPPFAAGRTLKQETL